MPKIITATPNDIPIIRKIAQSAFPETYAEILTPQQSDYMMEMMYSRDSLLQQMHGNHTFYIIYAEDNETPCGYVSVEKESDDVFHLQKIYLLKEFRGKGFGKILFDTAVEHVRRVHPSPCKMLLNVNRSNKSAQNFYKKRGMYKYSEGDFDIGNGFFMNDYIFALDLK